YTVTLTVTDNEGCSTRFVFTGQTAFCNAGSRATTSRQVTVTAPEPPAVTPQPQPTPPPPKLIDTGKPTFNTNVLNSGIRIACPAHVLTNCGASIVVRSGRLVVGKLGFFVPKGTSRVVRVKLNRAGQRLLAERGKLEVTITLIARDLSGRRVTISKSFT